MAYFYTTDPTGEDATAQGYARDVISCFVYQHEHAGSVKFYRWVNNATGNHFYTADPNGEGIQRIGFTIRNPAQGWVFPLWSLVSRLG
jgi:hypothetical protein